ncbi:hypothetical protein VPH35_031065 [Triticum aestivum]
MSSDGGPTVAVKLFIDKEKKRVLFLTLPLGTIVRLLGKQSQVGCLDELYKSVETLNEDHFQTKECKAMLLSPVNAAAFHLERLKVKVDDTNQSGFYTCTLHQQFSSVPPGCKLGCSSSFWKCPPHLLAAVGDYKDGVFVNNGPKYIVTDDLQVAPASTGLVFSLFDRFGLQDQARIEEKIVELNANKISSLLKNVLITKQPLTGLCFDVRILPEATRLDQLPENVLPKESGGTKPVFNAVTIKLVHTKDKTTVLYAEVGGDFVDTLFGLLCVPLGSIIKSYGEWSSNGSIDGLYRSIDGSARTCMKQGCPTLLLTPKLAPFFGCSRNVLQTEEMSPRSLTFSCFTCRAVKIPYGPSGCSCSYRMVMERTVTETNPKCQGIGSGTDMAYVKGGLRKFLVTSDLRVLDFTMTNTLQVMRAARIPKEKLVETDLTLDQTQVLKLLRATMLTRDALTSLLLPRKK